MSALLDRARLRFRAAFGREPEAGWRAPGRVNLIGEHVDYSGGLVMPMAIERDTIAVGRARTDGRLRVASAERGQIATVELDACPGPAREWHDYAVGVAIALRERGIAIEGADVAVASDVPLGAGLSSSAALEIAVAGLLTTLAGADGDLRLLAAAGTEAENAFVGVRSGIMDQLVSALAIRDHALLIDCASGDTTPLAIPPHFGFVVADSGIRHALAGSAYNDRRDESDRVAVLLGDLRRAVPGDVDRLIPDDVLRRRARHIISENARVAEFARALGASDATVAGALMNASHESLRSEYEVSIPEIDELVAFARRATGVAGARLTGGGFGGSIVVLVTPEHIDALVRTLSERAVSARHVVPSDGASRITRFP